MHSPAVVSVGAEARSCLPVLSSHRNGSRCRSGLQTTSASRRDRHPAARRLATRTSASATAGPGHEATPGSARRLSPTPVRAFLESETQRGLKPTVPKPDEDSAEDLNGHTAALTPAESAFVDLASDTEPERAVSESKEHDKPRSSGGVWAGTGAFFKGLLGNKGDKAQDAQVKAEHEALPDEEDGSDVEEDAEVDGNVQIQFMAGEAEALRDELVVVKASLDAELENSSSLAGQVQQHAKELNLTKEQMMSLQGKLERAVSKASALEDQERRLQEELRQAKKRIVAEAKGRKVLRAEGARLRSQLANSQVDLNSMAYKLEAEKTVSLEKDKAISALRSELENSMNTFEEEQDKSKRLNMDMSRMQRALSIVQSEKNKVGGRVEVLSERLRNAESRAKRYQGELKVERGTRSEITAAVAKLREVISTVQAEKQHAMQAADSLAKELGKEKAARSHVEEMVSVMQRELEGVQNGTLANADKAEAALRAFRDEVALMDFGDNSTMTESRGQ